MMILWFTCSHRCAAAITLKILIGLLPYFICDIYNICVFTMFVGDPLNVLINVIRHKCII